MGPPTSYRDLDVWQQAVELTVVIAAITKCFPRHELFVLTVQLRRAALSISSNIAEGYGRSTRQEYIRFLRIARGSAAEVSSLLTVARRLGYLDDEQAETPEHLCDRVSAMLTRLLQALESRRA
jgi:four helix bundle protein